MSTYLNSPGVASREVDSSQITGQPTTVGAAIIGPTVKGPVEVPTVVSSYSEYVNVFGDSFSFGSPLGSANTSYLTSISAESYFTNGGDSLLVTRVVSGSFTSATSTPILNTVSLGTGIVVGTDTNLTSSISTFPTGVQWNTSYTVTPETNGAGQGLELQYTPSLLAGNVEKYQINVTKPGTGYVAGNTLTIPLAQLGANPDGRLIPGANNLSQSIDTWEGASYPIRQSGWKWATGVADVTGSYGTGKIQYATGQVGPNSIIMNLEILENRYSAYDNNFNIGEQYGITVSQVTSNGVLTPIRILFTLTANNFITPAPLIITLQAGDIVGSIGDVAFELETLSKGAIMNSASPSTDALEYGTVDNIRWEIPTVNTSSGEFSLLVRRGDDTSNEKTVLEVYNRLSLDPNSPYYISKVIGDQSQTIATEGTDSYLETTGDYANRSKYIRVKSVAYKTPNYLGATGTPSALYKSYLPAAQSGSFTGAQGATSPNANATFYENIVENVNYTSQGVPAESYASAIALMANKDDYRYNIITVPGLTYANTAHVSTLTTLVQNTQNRGDAIAVVDVVNYGASIASVKSAAAAINSSYAATYWPWVELQDPSTGTRVSVPPSTIIPGVFAYTDKVAAPWFAPAGLKRGVLGTTVVGERKLSQTTRDDLYTSKVNPITYVNGAGSIVYGQKTLQTAASALDRINVRRLLIEMKTYFEQIAGGIVFEQNSAATRNSFINKVTPYLESIQQNQGLYAFKIVMDETNNTADVIDRNQLVGQVYIQPTKTAEFIYLDFNITPTGVAFPS
jgi:hypothetical protein